MRTTLSNSLVAIRRYDTVDVPLLYEAARESTREVSVWLPWCHSHYSMEDSLEWILQSGKRWDEKREFHFGIFDLETGTLIGGVGLNELKPEHRLANLGYWVRSHWTGRGLATAAASLAAKFGFEELLLDRIEILAALGNKGSQRVAQKLGANKEGILRNRLVIHGRAHDAVVFSLIGSEWRNVTHSITEKYSGDENTPLLGGASAAGAGVGCAWPAGTHPGALRPPPLQRRGLSEEEQSTKMKTINLQPIVLKGEHARLEPLDGKHTAGLFVIGQDEIVWRSRFPVSRLQRHQKVQ